MYLLVFHAYINEMDGSRSKISSKKSRQTVGFNSGVKELIIRTLSQSASLDKFLHYNFEVISAFQGVASQNNPRPKTQISVSNT
jgi:hypothetical protein